MDEINTTFEDPDCKKAFLWAFRALCESDRNSGQLRPPALKDIAGDQTEEIAA